MRDRLQQHVLHGVLRVLGMAADFHAEGIDRVLQERQRPVNRFRPVLANQLQRLLYRLGHVFRVADATRSTNIRVGKNPRRLPKLAPRVAEEMLAQRNRDRAPSLVIAGILLRQAVEMVSISARVSRDRATSGASSWQAREPSRPTDL